MFRFTIRDVLWLTSVNETASVKGGTMLRRVKWIAPSMLICWALSPVCGDEPQTEGVKGDLRVRQTWTFSVSKVLSKELDRLTSDPQASATWKEDWTRVRAQIRAMEVEVTDTLTIQQSKGARPSLTFIAGQAPIGRVVLVVSDKADQIAEVPIVIARIGPMEDKMNAEGQAVARSCVITLEWQAGKRTGIRDGLAEVTGFVFESVAVTLNAAEKAAASPIP